MVAPADQLKRVHIIEEETLGPVLILSCGGVVTSCGIIAAGVAAMPAALDARAGDGKVSPRGHGQLDQAIITSSGSMDSPGVSKQRYFLVNLPRQ